MAANMFLIGSDMIYFLTCDGSKPVFSVTWGHFSYLDGLGDQRFFAIWWQYTNLHMYAQ